jgi:hypothetical protein
VSGVRQGAPSTAGELEPAEPRGGVVSETCESEGSGVDEVVVASVREADVFLDPVLEPDRLVRDSTFRAQKSGEIASTRDSLDPVG